ncbi:MAG: hypothetical protein WC483_00190 [Candidatus Paceibacterota bacterium]
MVAMYLFVWTTHWGKASYLGRCDTVEEVQMKVGEKEGRVFCQPPSDEKIKAMVSNPIPMEEKELFIYYVHREFRVAWAEDYSDIYWAFVGTEEEHETYLRCM